MRVDLMTIPIILCILALAAWLCATFNVVINYRRNPDVAFNLVALGLVFAMMAYLWPILNR